MSVSERVRLETFGRAKRGEITVVKAAEILGLSIRQARRVWKRFGAQGDSGLVHGLRGRASNRRLSAETASLAVKLQQERYSDFGPTFCCEKLLSEHGLAICPDTLVSLLKSRGLWVRRRRRGKHRKRRERRSMLGMHGSAFANYSVQCFSAVMWAHLPKNRSWIMRRGSMPRIILASWSF